VFASENINSNIVEDAEHGFLMFVRRCAKRKTPPYTWSYKTLTRLHLTKYNINRVTNVGFIFLNNSNYRFTYLCLIIIYYVMFIIDRYGI